MLPVESMMRHFQPYHLYSILFSLTGDVSSTRQSKSERAGLVLKVGRMLQWMCLVKVIDDDLTSQFGFDIISDIDLFF